MSHGKTIYRFSVFDKGFSEIFFFLFISANLSTIIVSFVEKIILENDVCCILAPIARATIGRPHPYNFYIFYKITIKILPYGIL